MTTTAAAAPTTITYGHGVFQKFFFACGVRAGADASVSRVNLTFNGFAGVVGLVATLALIA